MRTEAELRSGREFMWSVAVSGYRVITAGPEVDSEGRVRWIADMESEDSTRLIVPRSPGGPLRENRPLRDDPGIHRTFAEIVQSGEGAVEFASYYGTLGDHRPAVYVVGLSTSPLRAEFLKDWLSEASLLRDALPAWDRMKRGLAGIGDATLVCGWITPRLERLRGVAVPNVAGNRTLLSALPSNLCAAIWLQFQRETEGLLDLLRCPVCHRWFSYHADQIKTKRQFCSQACRSKAYRNRKFTAQRLRTEGRTIEEIANILNSTPEIVRGWIGAEIILDDEDE